MYLKEISYPPRQTALTTTQLKISDWPVGSDNWVVLGDNQSGKELLFDILQGRINYSGESAHRGKRIAEVSFSLQQALLTEERKLNATDWVDDYAKGRPLIEFLLEIDSCQTNCEQTATRYGLGHLLQQGFRNLSTGETRKLLLARAALQKPDLLLLQDPYEGLDKVSRVEIDRLLYQQVTDGTQVLLMLDRPQDKPNWLTKAALFSQGQLTHYGDYPQLQSHLHRLATTGLIEPPPAPITPTTQLDPSEPLLELRDVTVRYGDQHVFSQLNWRVEQGESWQIVGPNGSGKTTLLKLISGDHPQCYSNWIRQFGFQRGSGETVWDVKKHLALVSSELHLSYRPRINVLGVVLSGYFDTIGLYQTPSAQQISHTRQWLQWFNIDSLASEPFHTLSYGEQRLVLIIRALVKSPLLLILDEPLQGLDEVSAQRVLATINRLVESKTCQLLYVSHREERQLSAHCQQLKLG